AGAVLPALFQGGICLTVSNGSDHRRITGCHFRDASAFITSVPSIRHVMASRWHFSFPFMDIQINFNRPQGYNDPVRPTALGCVVQITGLCVYECNDSVRARLLPYFRTLYIVPSLHHLQGYPGIPRRAVVYIVL
ncbi:hypothetical protein KIPB_010088, partial [Kipferlia bialata]